MKKSTVIAKKVKSLRSPNLDKEYFFTIQLTENEHDIVENMIREFCDENGFTLVYYRNFKGGHIPMQREVKIKGDKVYRKLTPFFLAEGIMPENYHANHKSERIARGYTKLGWEDRMKEFFKEYPQFV